ncbi:hypothetical protein [uncultured Desulfosarcina sp.]|nr:hypothetical protein [uncultured Desulfosarcina sp.]
MLKKESEPTYRKLFDGVNMATMVHGGGPVQAGKRMHHPRPQPPA